MRANPLEEYRRAQRAVRREFAAFTTANCPTCPAPCCRRPARIAPVDILLAEATGWRAQVQSIAGKDPVEHVAGVFVHALATAPEAEEAPPEPCEFLGEKGCTFPNDLRPYGCTAYICPIMYERMDRKALARVKRLLRDLERAHVALMAQVHPMAPADE